MEKKYGTLFDLAPDGLGFIWSENKVFAFKKAAVKYTGKWEEDTPVEFTVINSMITSVKALKKTKMNLKKH